MRKKRDGRQILKDSNPQSTGPTEGFGNEQVLGSVVTTGGHSDMGPLHSDAKRKQQNSVYV